MMKTDIPIYRAKKINCNEYVKGNLLKGLDTSIIMREFYAIQDEIYLIEEIDSSTLAIHFPDMINSEGTKIFASLSEDGKGGDKLDVLDCEADYVAVYNKHSYGFGAMNISPKKDEWEFELFYDLDVKVTGIQE